MVSLRFSDFKSFTKRIDKTKIKGFKNIFVKIKKIAPQEKKFSLFNKTSPVAVQSPIRINTGKVFKVKETNVFA